MRFGRLAGKPSYVLAWGSAAVAGVAAAALLALPPAATAAPAVARAPGVHLHSTSVAASPSVTIHYGDSTTLKTTVTDTTTSQPIDGADVSLLAKSNGPGYATVATPTTNSAGVAHAVVTPKANTYYKWSYAGDSTHHMASSTVSTVSVSQIVHAALSKHRVKHGKTVEVYGTVKPHGAGKTVTLEKRVAGKWKKLAITARLRVQKLPNGKTKPGYILPFTTRHKGRVKLRVASDETRQNPGGISNRVTLRVT